MPRSGRTEALRAKLLQGCRVSGVSSLAADLETLRLQDGGWWQKVWIASHGSLETFEFLQRLIGVSDQQR
jgi:hypothetical protein